MDTIPTVIIAIGAIIYSFLLSFLLEKYGERKKLMDIQKEVNETNKAYFEAGKRNDKKRVAELEEKMKRFPGLMKESMILNVKSIIIILPTFTIALWLVKAAFPAFSIALPLDLPVPRLQPDRLFEMKHVFGAYGWFIISSVVFGGIAQFVYSKVKPKAPKQQEEKK